MRARIAAPKGLLRICALAGAAGTSAALALSVPVSADVGGLPVPVPSVPISTPPLPKITPLPVPTVTIPTLPGGSGSRPSPTPAAGGMSTAGSTGTGGGHTTSGVSTGSAGTGAGAAAGNQATGGSSATDSHPAAPAPALSTGRAGPFPAIPLLPRGVAQNIGWFLLILVPLMLLVWVIALVRALGRLRLMRSPGTLIAIAAELGLSPREIAGISPAALEKIRDQLAVDELTGCMRRATGVASLDREVSRARRERTPLAIAFVDADGLKHANDTLGHAAGDQLLKDVAAALKARLRGSDFVFRYGGDEFVCVLPGATAASAMEVFTDVQVQLRQSGRSFSLGVTELRADDHDSMALLARADEALYAAKRELKAGRQPAAPVRVLPEDRVS